MKKVLFIFAVALTAGFFTSCDEDFAEGFRQGWNSTAPPEYRYSPEYNEEDQNQLQMADKELPATEVEKANVEL